MFTIKQVSEAVDFLYSHYSLSIFVRLRLQIY